MTCNRSGEKAEQIRVLKEIKDWIAQEALIPKNIPDQNIKWFAKGSEYNTEEVKLMIKNHYELKALRPSIFRNRDPGSKELKHVWETVYMVCFPQESKEDKVFYVGLKNMEPRHFDMVAVERLFHMIVDAFVYLEIASDTYVLILDGKGISMRHFNMGSLPQIKAALKYLQTGIPLAMKEIHVINTTVITRKLFFLTKPFMEKRLTDKIMFHAKSDKLLEIIPVEKLPLELGGKHGTLDQLQEETRTTIDSLKEWFSLEEKSRAQASRSSAVQETLSTMGEDSSKEMDRSVTSSNPTTRRSGTESRGSWADQGGGGSAGGEEVATGGVVAAMLPHLPPPPPSLTYHSSSPITRLDNKTTNSELQSPVHSLPYTELDPDEDDPKSRHRSKHAHKRQSDKSTSSKGHRSEVTSATQTSRLESTDPESTSNIKNTDLK